MFLEGTMDSIIFIGKYDWSKSTQYELLISIMYHQMMEMYAGSLY